MSHPTPWFDGLAGVAYRYYDLRMNVVPLLSDMKESLRLWRDVVHWWVDPSIRMRFVESGDEYWFVMGADSQRPDTNLAVCRRLPVSGHYERFKRGHGGEAYLRFGVYTEKALAGSKKGEQCGCGHEARDHDEDDGDACLYVDCGCKKFSTFQVNLLKRKKTVTDIAFLDEDAARDDPLAWNCLNSQKYSSPG